MTLPTPISSAASLDVETPIVPTAQLAPAAPPPPPLPPAPVRFPINWILSHAAAPIQYRALTEVARVADPESLSNLPLTHRSALMLAMGQSADGTWGRNMLSVPSAKSANFEGIGTIPAVRRLLEYGWSKDSPPLLHARRMLFRLLAEDEDPAFLFELAGKQTQDEENIRRARLTLREAAAATLAQAGYEGDPRLRGAARRILNRLSEYLRSPISQKPFIRQGNQHMLAAEACPPSIYTMSMLAYMPLFRAENHHEMDALYAHVIQAQPRQDAVQLCGKLVLSVPHLVLGDALPHRNAADADVPYALYWLELMARLGFLKRNEVWSKLFDRFLEDRDRDGVWHPHKGMAVAKSAIPQVWPVYPLEDQKAGDERWTDITFRLGLIARLAGRTIELV